MAGSFKFLCDFGMEFHVRFSRSRARATFKLRFLPRDKLANFLLYLLWIVEARLLDDRYGFILPTLSKYRFLNLWIGASDCLFANR
jgi:hypothetical protein